MSARENKGCEYCTDAATEEMEYQKGITELYEKTQDFGRIDFVKVIYDLQQELSTANDKLKKIEEYIIEDNYKEEEIWCSDVIPILKIIEGDEEE